MRAYYIKVTFTDGTTPTIAVETTKGYEAALTKLKEMLKHTVHLVTNFDLVDEKTEKEYF